jgi:hypothetical protein
MAKTKATDKNRDISRSKNMSSQPDSAFPGLVKLMYGVLQCIHHIGFLEDSLAHMSLPKALIKKVEELNSFIKPARSTLDVTFDLNLTNQNWANQTMNVLIKHYINVLKNLKSEIISVLSSSKGLDFDRAQINAIKWGRQNYKSKLTETTLSEFSNFISNLLPKKSGNGLGGSCQKTATPLKSGQKRTRSPQVNTPSKRPDLKATPPTAKGSKAPHLKPLTTSPLTQSFPSNKSTPTNRTSQPGVSFSDALKSPAAPNRNLGRDTNFRPSKFFKYRHTVLDKTQWHLPQIIKKTLLFGSSNLSRINLDKHPDVQVECYPGANFNHFRTMVTKYKFKGKSQPDNIVLNIGINSKDQLIASVSNQLRNMISSIRKTFPKSKLYFVELNFSNTLTTCQKSCLNQINLAVKTLRDVKIIPAIPACDFKVGQDNIHWTENTANKLYRSWMRCLNLN